ncbi:MAG: type II toxin-antitoxin system VapC family toxin [Actinobacteria bacterium]|nr:type II toxin-antitoxin system VapC family toxin [Actinomycetota bacterium]
MPTKSRDAKSLLVDTSVALALLAVDHEEHRAAIEHVRGRTLGLAGHALFETYSLLTRLPPPLRVSPHSAERLISAGFPIAAQLSPGRSVALLARLAGAGIAGGSVYDALVAAAAIEHDLPLLSRDRRAVGTYQALGVRLELLA